MHEASDKKRLISFCGWTLDRYKMQAFNKTGESAKLTLKEFQLLETLARNLDKVLSRKQILSLSMGRINEVTERTVDTHVSRIRKKLHRDCAKQILYCERGKGYRLVSKIQD